MSSKEISKALTPLQSLRDLQAAIEKQHGIGSAILLGDKPIAAIPTRHTGSYRLDAALGGGFPRGRIVELIGAEGSGKSTLALHAVAEAQKAGEQCAFIDAEHALDLNYAKALHVKVDELLLSQPDNGEQALSILEAEVTSGAIQLAVVDSVAALTPRAELDGEIGDFVIGAHARLMSQAMRMLTGIISKTGVTVIFINQIRQKIGVTYGSNETTPGGNALKFYASQRLDIRRALSLRDAHEKIFGHRAKVKIIKNKIAPPFREVEFDIRYGQGIDAAAELFDSGVEFGLIPKEGLTFRFDNEKLGVGREKSIETIAAQEQIRAALGKKVIAALTERKT